MLRRLPQDQRDHSSAPVPCQNGKAVLARMHGRYLGKGDMYKGYFQVPLDEATQELLAIRSPLGFNLSCIGQRLCHLVRKVDRLSSRNGSLVTFYKD